MSKRKAKSNVSPERFAERASKLAKLVTPQSLEIDAAAIDESVFGGVARDCLLRFCTASPPSAKLRALVTLCEALVGGERGSADLLLPLLVLLVLRENPAYVCEHAEFIACRAPSLLRGIESYCYISFASALAFIENLDEHKLKIDCKEEFREKMKKINNQIVEWRAL